MNNYSANDESGPCLEATLHYLGLGARVVLLFQPLPDGGCACGNARCQHPGKHPIPYYDKPLLVRSPAGARAAFEQYPNANIGIKKAGVVVLDVDPRHGGDKSLVTLGELPVTVTAETGDGQHLWFRTELELRPADSALPGLDIKVPYSGGYVIAPPSLHHSGKHYRWADGRVLGEIEIAEAPESVLALAERAGENGSRPPAEPIPDAIPEGARKKTLVSLAGSMRKRGMTPSEIEAALLAVNANRCRPPLAVGEVAEIVKSAAKWEAGVAPVATTTAKLVESDLSVEPPPVTWLVEDMVPATGSTSFYGEGATGKTALIMAMAACIAEGHPFLGHEVAQGPVLWIDCEMGEEDARRRVWEVARGLGMAAPPENFHLFSTFDPLLNVFGNIEAAIKQYAPIAVFLDSLGAALGGMDASQAHNINPLMSRLQTLGVPPVLLDHQAKLQAGESYTAKLAFGSVYKFNRARAVWQIEKGDNALGEAGTLELLLRHMKSTFGRQYMEPIGVRLVFSPRTIAVEDVDVEASAALRAKLNKEQQVLLAVRGGVQTVAEIAGQTGLTESAVRNHLSRLAKRRQVEKVELAHPQPDHWFVTESGARPPVVNQNTGGEAGLPDAPPVTKVRADGRTGADPQGRADTGGYGRTKRADAENTDPAPETERCHRCGTPQAANTKICPACGATSVEENYALEGNDAEPTAFDDLGAMRARPDPNHCARCGGKLIETARDKFGDAYSCINCGWEQP